MKFKLMSKSGCWGDSPGEQSIVLLSLEEQKATKNKMQILAS
jgi:hypothetical protein